MYSKYEVSSTPPRSSPSDYVEPISHPKVDPLYEVVVVSAQQSKYAAASDVKMEDNPAYNTSVF